MPVFGFTGTPAGSGTVGDWILAGYYQNNTGVTGKGTKLSLYIDSDTTSTKLKLAIYSTKTGPLPDALLAVTEELDPSAYGTGWHDFNFVVQPDLIDGAYYWLAFWSNSELIYGRSTTGGVHAYLSLSYSGNFPNPFGGIETDTNLFGINCTVAVAGGPSIPVAKHVRSLSPNFHVY